MKMGNTLGWTPPVCVEIPLRDTSSFGWLILFPITMSASGHAYSVFFFAFGIFIVMGSFFIILFISVVLWNPKPHQNSFHQQGTCTKDNVTQKRK